MPVIRAFRTFAASGIGVLALVGGPLLSGCSASSPTASGITYPVGNGVLTTYAVGHRKQAPMVSGVDLAGKPLSLSLYAGKVIVLNFWASWCPPCRAEAPALEQVYTDTKVSGVQFVGVDIAETGNDDGPNFVATHNIDYPSFRDQAARLALAFRKTGIPPQSPPSTLIIDRSGRIAARGLGQMSFTQLEAEVRSVAAERT